MSMRIFRLFVVAVSAAISLSGCLNLGSSAPPPASGLTLAPGDGRITVSWDMSPNLEYWLFYAPASSISTDNWTSVAGGRALIKVSSPYVLTGLTNGVTYAFTLNARTDGGPGGAGTPSVSTVPRLAGSAWLAGAPLGAGDLRGVTYGSVHIAVGLGGTMYSSSDGKSWSPMNPVTGSNLNGAVFGNGIYLAVGAGGTVLYSADALAWTAQPSGINDDLYAVASNRSNLNVAVGANGKIVRSADGKTWSVAANSATTGNLYGVAYSSYGNGMWVAVGAGGTIVTSTDASNWTVIASGTTADLRGAVYFPTAGAGAFSAVGASGALVTSPDGASWTAQPALTTATLNAVTYGTRFVAVGNGGAVFTSADGIGWTAQSSGSASNLYAIEHALYSYSAVGAGGANLYSQ